MTHTIAIVDDHLLIAKALGAIIENFDHFTVLFEAGHGRELIEKLKQKKNIPDIILLDISMPVMDGFELAERLRKIRPLLPILYMSAYPEKAESRPERTRNVPFVPKPFTSLTLAGKIREILDKPRAGSTAG